MRDDSTQEISSRNLKAAIVVSHYHSQITTQLEGAAREFFIKMGGNEEDCLVFQAAGSWEIPVIAKQVLKHKQVDLVVGLGCIITGETTHDRVIAHSIAQGLMDVSIQSGRPVAMGILTCQSIAQAQARAGGKLGNKGEEAMQAAIHAASTIRSLQS